MADSLMSRAPPWPSFYLRVKSRGLSDVTGDAKKIRVAQPASNTNTKPAAPRS